MLTVVRGLVRRASVSNAVLLALHQTNPSCASSPASTTPGRHVFDPKLLASLVCPLSKGELRYDADKQELVSQEVGVAYPVVAGIPRLMPIAGRLIDNASSNTNQ